MTRRRSSGARGRALRGRPGRARACGPATGSPCAWPTAPRCCETYHAVWRLGGGGHPAAVPAQRGRAAARAQRLRRGGDRDHAGVPAQGRSRRRPAWTCASSSPVTPARRRRCRSTSWRPATRRPWPTSTRPAWPRCSTPAAPPAGPRASCSATTRCRRRRGRRCWPGVDDDYSVSLLPLPLAHAYGLLVSSMALHAVRPNRTVLMRWFDPTGLAAAGAGAGRADGGGGADDAAVLLTTARSRTTTCRALRRVVSGSAPLPAEVLQEWNRRVPHVEIVEGYGCSETAALACTTPCGTARPGSVGRRRPASRCGSRRPTASDAAGRRRRRDLHRRARR